MSHRLLVIDGNNLLYAGQQQDTKLVAGEQETTAVFSTLRMMRGLIEKFPESTRAVVLWDSPHTWRHKEYPEYKAQRAANAVIKAQKESIKTQRPIAQEFLRVLGVPQMWAEGYEADDIAGHLHQAYAGSKSISITYVTNDGDWTQLVAPNIKCYNPRRGFEKTTLFESFELDTGYRSPKAYLFAKALMGDVSDNLPGAGGIGEVTAKALTEECETYDQFRVQWPAISAEVVVGHPLKRAVKKLDDLYAQVGDTHLNLNRNLRFMDLRSVHIPASVRHVDNRPLDVAAFKQLCARYAFTSVLTDATNFLAPFLALKEKA